jgi:hypothetical protein
MTKENEPVAWGMEKNGVILDVISPSEHERLEGGYTTPLYTTPQRDLESTTDMMMELADRLGELPDDVDPRAWEHLLVYAPQRTWVGLKDDDEIPWDGVDAKSFARAIETKLKEKNT